jgi:4-hydroxy-2-oxoheptanedioate aldolase
MLGIFSKTTDSNFIEAAGLAGLDFIILDQEHGPVNLETLHHHIRSAQVTGMQSIVRVANNEAHNISAALDTGADGVQVPNITSYEEAIKAVNAARFYPHGMRGVCRFVRAANFGLTERETYFPESNNKQLILQIESKKGVESIDKILGIDEFDILFVGPYDLSQSLGVPGQIDHPDVIKLIKEIITKITHSGKIAGTFVDTPEGLRQMRDLGFEYLAYSVDISLFVEKIRSLKTLNE